MKFQIQTTLTKKQDLPGGYMRLAFDDRIFAQQASPGQFLTLRTSPVDVPLLRRPFGIHDVDNDRVSILVRVIGPGTRQLSLLKTGDPIDVLGPIGNGFSDPDPNVIPILIAGGIGIAPLLYFARHLQATGAGPIRLYFGGATATDLPSLEMFEKLGIETKVTTEDGSAGQKGLITMPLKRDIAADPGAFAIFACGPHPMLAAVADIAREANVPCQVSLENIMACGVGSCLGCVTEVMDCGCEPEKNACYERVCEDGPVFDAEKIRWKEAR